MLHCRRRWTLLRLASLTLVVGAALLMSWALTPATARPARLSDPPTTPVGWWQSAEPLVAQLAGDVDRLRRRLDDAPVFVRPARDPFRFAGRSRSDAAPVAEGVEPPAAPPILPRLVAILSDRRGDEVVRRAALAVGGVISIVSVGEPIGSWRIVRVDADGVDLVNPVTRQTVRVTLR